MNSELHKASAQERIGFWLLLGLLICLGTTLALYRLDSKSLWGDEVTTVQISIGSLRAIPESLQHQHNAPPLYYLILHLFTRLSTSEFMVRLPSVLFGTLALGACFCVAYLLFGRAAGFLATLLLALSPLHLQFSQEARMYTLFEALALLSLCFFLKSVQTRRIGFWIGYTLTTLLSVYTHYFTVFYVLIQAIFLAAITARRWLLARREEPATAVDKQVWIGFLLSLGALLILYLPWLPSALARSQGTGLGQDFAFALTRTLQDLGGGQATALPFVLGGLFAWGLVACWLTQKSEEGLLLGLWVLLPPLLVYLFLFYAQSFFAVRYVLFILPLYLIGIAYGSTYLLQLLVQRLRHPALGYVAGYTILVLALGIANIEPVQAMYARPKQPCRELAPFLNEHVADGEVVVVEPRWFTQCLAYYGLESAQTADGSLEEFQTITAKATGVWYIRLSNAFVDPTGNIQKWITENEYVKLMRGTVEAGGVLLYYKSMDATHQRDMLPVLQFFAKLDPGYTHIQHLLAADYKSQEAIDTLLRQAESEPNDAAVQSSVGWALHKLKRYEEAATVFARAVELEGTPFSYRGLGDSFYNLGDFEKALAAFQQWAELEPDSAAAHSSVAWTLFRLKRYEEAVSAFSQALAIEENPGMYPGLANSYRLLGDNRQALAAFQRWAELQPDNASAHKSVGWEYLLLGDCPSAVKSFEKALEIDPQLQAALDGLAQCPR